MNNEKYIKDIDRYFKLVDLEFLRNKKIIITGATGQICSYLIDLLIKYNIELNANIVIYPLCRTESKLKKRFPSYYDNPNFCPLIQNVCDKINIDEIDYIIHGASNTHPVAYSTDPIGTISTNILGLYNLLDLAVEKKVKKFIFLSSVEIYGENDRNIEAFTENDFGYLNCNTLRAGYSESKRLGEALCQAYIQEHNLDIVIPRISRVYGPTILESDTKALSQFLNNILDNKDIILKSDGKQYFSYVYVGDVVSAIILLMNKGLCGEAYNISDKNSNIHLKDLANMVASYGNKNVLFELPSEIEKKGYSKSTIAIIDSSKLESIGYEAITPLEIGIPLTIEILKDIRNS